MYGWVCEYHMKKKNTRYIFVVGGVMSGIGKGITTSSIAVLLDRRKYRVNIMKIDPYLNVDAGTMNPTEHGEVFVINSGLETDQDMGNYERFLHRDLTSDDYLTSGMIYKSVIERERNLGFDGKCVEAIPHVVNTIRERIEASANNSKAEIQIVEIGGTIGDYQNLLFLEAGRQMQMNNPDEVCFLLVTYLPYPASIGELKTRPTQHAIHKLKSYGINPSVVVARSEIAIDTKRQEKIANACNVKKENIISAPDVESIWEVPISFAKEKIDEILIKELNLSKRKEKDTLLKWKQLAKSSKKNKQKTIRVGIIGKYFQSGSNILKDVYVSIIEAVKFSAHKEGVFAEMEWLVSKKYEGSDAKRHLKELNSFDCLIIPGGFGKTGVDGKLAVIRYARENGIPILGICYGMQLMAVEFARSVLGKRSANTLEIDPKTKHDVITIIDEQRKNISEKKYGGSMRLGNYNARVKKGTILNKLYGSDKITERHRHRYEFNNDYIDNFENSGMYISAYSQTGLVEAIELDTHHHPFFIGVQYHPEFTARPFTPNPLFTGLLRAAKQYKHKHRNSERAT